MASVDWVEDVKKDVIGLVVACGWEDRTGWGGEESREIMMLDFCIVDVDVKDDEALTGAGDSIFWMLGKSPQLSS